MARRNRPSFVLPIVALFVGCSSTALLEGTDDMGAGASAPTTGQVGAICESCLTTSCSWQVTECSADPSCARWYTCASQCPATTGETPWGSTCVLGCPEPDSATGLRLRDDLLACVDAAAECCGLARDTSETGGVDGGYAGSGGGASPVPGGGNGGATDFAAGECVGETCGSCLLAIKANKGGCLGADESCAQTISDCYHENGFPENGATNSCWLHVTRRDCNRANADVQLPGECGYVVPVESEALTLDTMRCAAAYCPPCVRNGDQDCFNCELDNCPDEIKAWMNDVEAQRLSWCIDACVEAPDPFDCKSSCANEHPNGKVVLQLLATCRQGACSADCS